MTTTCPGCSLVLPAMNEDKPTGLEASFECQAKYHELTVYTLEHPRPQEFIHQVAVDTYAAQHSGPMTKAITITFALIGLYCFLEKGMTGREVQLTHMRLARGSRRTWPTFASATMIGTPTVLDVLAAPAGAGRDRKIVGWARSVWQRWTAAESTLRTDLDKLLVG